MIYVTATLKPGVEPPYYGEPMEPSDITKYFDFKEVKPMPITKEQINEWFERHFNGTTPGTELHMQQQRALTDLHNLINPVAPEEQKPASEPDSENNDK